MLFIPETLIVSASTKSSSTSAVLNPSAGTVISISAALLTSIAILINNEKISKIKIRYTKLRDWIVVITLLDEKTLKQSMVDKKIDQIEAEEFIIIILMKDLNL